MAETTTRDGERTFEAFVFTHLAALRRQAYLLTGDRRRADGLAQRAVSAARLQFRWHGEEGAAEFVRAELVRSFVADPAVRAPEPGTASRPRTLFDPAGGGQAAVWAALRSLSPRRRAVIVLRYDEGLSDEQIASRLGIPAGHVVADADAGLLTLGSVLRGGDPPLDRLAAVFAEAGGGGAGWSGPADPPAPASTPTAAPPAHRAADRATAVLQPPTGARRLALRPLLAVAAILAVIAAATLLPGLPHRAARGPAHVPTAPASSPGAAGSRPAPTRTVLSGLLGWPERGPLAHDQDTRVAALAAWRRGAAAAAAPARGETLLYAGDVDGRRVVLAQAVDASGRARVAQLAGTGSAGLRLVGAAPISDREPAISIGAIDPAAGPVRVLVSPEAAVRNGLLASGDVKTTALRPVPVDPDGLSAPLPALPGNPQCSQIVVLRPASGGRSGPAVLGSGVAVANRLILKRGAAELTAPTLDLGRPAAPASSWFTDGAALAQKVGGPVLLAALGPDLPARPLSAEDPRPVRSQVYELRRGGQRLIGSVVHFGGRIVCVNVDRVPDVGVRGPLTALIQRCPLPGTAMMAGLVHVVAGPGVAAVRIALTATPSPPGQKDFATTVSRPAGSIPDGGFAVIQIVPMDFPCGTGTVTPSSLNQPAASAPIPVYTG